LTRPGMAALALAPLYLGLVAHSDFIQYHQRQGVAWNTKVAGLVPGSEESQQATNMAIEHLEHVAGWALVDTAELHNRLGQLYAHDRASGEAIEHLKAAIEIDPDNVSALVALGEVLMLENRNQEAMDSLLTALAIRPGGTRGANGLLSLMLRDEAIRAAATPRLKGLVETFTAASPERIESQLRLAEAYVASMQLDLALPLLDTVLSAHADHPVGLRTLSIILQRNPSHRAANELAARIQQQLSAP
jgi:thioredoxin-like negative regulator of GroEL